jgi:ribosomal protein L6P/L9E
MSKVGKVPVAIPDGVNVSVSGGSITVKASTAVSSRGTDLRWWISRSTAIGRS